VLFGACLDQAADLIDRDVQDHGCVGIWSGIVDEHANAVLCQMHLVLERREDTGRVGVPRSGSEEGVSLAEYCMRV